MLVAVLFSVAGARGIEPLQPVTHPALVGQARRVRLAARGRQTVGAKRWNAHQRRAVRA